MNSPNDIEKDFNEFLQLNDKEAPPASLSEQVYRAIEKDLKVKPWFLSIKILLLYSFSSLLFLYFCPQFGVSWGTPSTTLTTLYMRFGHHVCAALCAVTLVGGNFTLLALALKDSESYWLKQKMPWAQSTLSFLTLLVLFSNGATPHHHYGEFALWLISGIIAASLFFEFTRKSKLFLQSV